MLSDSEPNTSDSSPTSAQPHAVQRKSSLSATPLPHLGEGQPERSTSGPSIVVDAPGKSSAGGPAFSFESDASEPQPIDEWSSISQHSPDVEHSDDSTKRLDSSVDGVVIPETITYTLHIIFEKETVPIPASRISIQLNYTSSYQNIVENAKGCVRKHCESALAGKSLEFRTGDCTIIGDNNDNYEHSLSSQEDWEDIYTILVNFWTSNTHHHLHLDITQVYFGLLKKRLSDESFATSKFNEISDLMTQNFEGKWYISRIDLIRITSADMIQQILKEDPVPGLSVEKIQQRGLKLLAMCVRAQLQMKCLKELLDKGQGDDEISSRPLTVVDTCHTKCRNKFRDLVNHQEGFNAVEFWSPGEHKRLPSRAVVPVHYYSEERHKGNRLDGELKTSSVVEARELNEDDTARKHSACCGSGAYSKVYRVRLDRAHHRLSAVSLEESAPATT